MREISPRSTGFLRARTFEVARVHTEEMYMQRDLSKKSARTDLSHATQERDIWMGQLMQEGAKWGQEQSQQQREGSLFIRSREMCALVSVQLPSAVLHTAGVGDRGLLFELFWSSLRCSR